MKLTERQKKTLREKLLQEKEKLIKYLDDIGVRDKNSGGGFRSKMEPDEDLGRDSEANATDSQTYQIKISQENLFENKLRKIDQALNKMDNNEYGFCEECGEAIDYKRLEQNPTLELCLQCAK